MIRIIFITILFLSSNVFAATYLVCKNYDNELNVKLGNKKISIKYKSEDYIDFSNKILKWNEELIQLSHKENYLWERTRFENEFNDVEKHNCDNCRKTFKNDSFLCAHVCWLTEYVSQERTIKINIDRVSGILDWHNDRFQCEVKKKTLF